MVPGRDDAPRGMMLGGGCCRSADDAAARRGMLLPREDSPLRCNMVTAAKMHAAQLLHPSEFTATPCRDPPPGHPQHPPQVHHQLAKIFASRRLNERGIGEGRRGGRRVTIFFFRFDLIKTSFKEIDFSSQISCKFHGTADGGVGKRLSESLITAPSP